MKSYSAIVLAIIISVVAAIPIEQIDEEHAQTNAEDITAANGHHFGDRLANHQEPTATAARPKRQFPDGVLLNKQFFENIFHNSRISRGAGDVPTIDLHDLISAVEHTLVHSAQNLAASNVTNVNVTSTETDPISNNSVTNVQHIVLPITLPTPKSLVESVTSFEEITTIAVDHDEEDDIEHSQSKVDEVYHVERDYENVKPIEKSNLGILFPISLNPSADVHATTIIDEDHTDAPVTEETRAAGPSNITIIQTINSTQLIPTDSDVVHVHQQQITLFSANAGIFPNIHAVKAEDLPILAQTAEVTSPKAEPEDCSEEESSEESDESSEESKEGSSDSSSSEKIEHKKVSCTRKPSSPTPDVVKKTKTDELKEKIAEVEADPVILTQGI